MKSLIPKNLFDKVNHFMFNFSNQSEGEEFVEFAENKTPAQTSFLNKLYQTSVAELSNAQKESIDLNQLCSKLINNLDSIIKIANVEVFTDQLPTVTLHKDSIQHILEDVLWCVIEACIHTEDSNKSKIRIYSQHYDESSIQLSIMGSRHGMNVKKLNFTFDYITQSKETGTFQWTDRSLALSKRLIENMGGEIRIIANENKGICFTLVMPSQEVSGGQRNSELEQIDYSKVSNKKPGQMNEQLGQRG